LTGIEINNKALELGFSRCGFARCEPLENLRAFYDGMVADKRFAFLPYLKRYATQRMNPDLLLPGARTVICLTMNYFPPVQISGEDNFIISKYAYGHDYHRLMREKLDSLTSFMQSATSGIHTRSFVDSGPVLEKAWAQRCGIGWQGKNTLVINKSDGSFFYIGIILTDLEIEPNRPATNHCGACDKCVKACPAGALDTPYQLDIARCISYHIIENKTAIPDDVRKTLNGQIYGCDLCQDACPYNRFAKAHTTLEFLPSEELVNMRKNDWISLTEQDFTRIFPDSPVARIGYERLMRNIRANQKEMT
jgi:epoxyqueuosine reductase